MSAMCKRAGQRLHVLRKIKPFLHQDDIHIVYCAIIRSLFDYCCPVFAHLPVNLRNSLQRIEKRAHRLIYGNQKDIRCACDLDGYTRRREKICWKLFFQIIHNKDHLLHQRTPTPLPSSRRFCNFTCRTSKRQNSFFPYMTLLLNTPAMLHPNCSAHRLIL